MSVDGFFIKSSSFEKLLEMTKHESIIVIKGPKGIGKSTSLVGLLAYHSLRNIPTLLITHNSFLLPRETVSYLKDVKQRYKLGKNACIIYIANYSRLKGFVVSVKLFQSISLCLGFGHARLP